MKKRAPRPRKRAGACPRHPGEPALLTCDVCRSPGCPECIHERWGKNVCPSCAERHGAIRTRAALFAIFLFLIFGSIGYFAWSKLRQQPDQAGEVRALTERLSKEPGNDNLVWRLVNLHTAKGEFAKATGYLSRLVEKHPGSQRLLLRMVLLQYRAKDYQQSLMYMDRLKRMDPNNFNLLKIEGEIWKAYGNTEECEKAWLSAYHLKPSDVSHALNLVDLMISQNRIKDAERVLRATLKVVRTLDDRRTVQRRLEEVLRSK